MLVNTLVCATVPRVDPQPGVDRRWSADAEDRRYLLLK